MDSNVKISNLSTVYDIYNLESYNVLVCISYSSQMLCGFVGILTQNTTASF